MKLFLASLLLTVALAHAEGPPASSSNRPQSTVIPAGAVQVSPYLYSLTDKDGKKWFYRETPFGVMRYTEDQVAPPPKSPAPDGIRAFEDGDNVRFERLGPFGIYHWTKDKSALDPDEQAALERERARTAAKRY